MATLNDEVAAATAAATAKAAKLVPHHQHPVNKGRSPESRLGLKGKKYSPHDVLGPILDSQQRFHERYFKPRHGATIQTVVERANAARAAAAEKAKKQRVAAKAAQAKGGGDAAGPSSPAA